MSSSPTRLRRILEAWLEASGMEEGLAKGRLYERWEELVGPRIGAVSRPIDVRGEELLVEVEDPAWRNELSLMQGQLLEQIQDHPELPHVRSIRFVGRRGGGSRA